MRKKLDTDENRETLLNKQNMYQNDFIRKWYYK